MTVVDLPLPTLPPDPELDVQCHCGSRRRDHAGRKHLGHCRGHVIGADVPEGFTANPVTVRCGTDCRRFWPAKGERLRLRALASFEEPLDVAIAEADRARARSRKTEEARAAGLFGVGPSDLNTCPKRVEYRERPPEDYEPVPVDRMAAYEGTILHEGITRARRLRYPWRKFALAVHVPGLDRPGELDEWDPVLALIIDYKSAGDYKWDRVEASGPPDSEWEQLLTYGLALEEEGHPVEWLELHYYNRENFRDPKRFRRRYSRAAALAVVQRLHAMLDDLAAGRELPRTEAGPGLSAICDRYCEAVGHCWQVPLAELARRTPVGWMTARTDDDVAAALASYVRAHREFAVPGAAEKDRVKVAVDGVPWGRYGDHTYRKVGGKTTWENDDAARLEQLAEEMRQAADENRPPRVPEELVYPQRERTTTVRVEIKPVARDVLEQEARDRGDPVPVAP